MNIEELRIKDEYRRTKDKEGILTCTQEKWTNSTIWYMVSTIMLIGYTC